MKTLTGFLKQVDIYGARCALFFAALCLYAFAGSPTPDAPGWVELVIAALLVCVVGLPDVYGALRIDAKAPLWRASGQILLLYGLSMPVLMSALYGHELSQALRDIFPFLFLLLPVFLSRFCGGELFKFTLAGALVIGVSFAVRGVIGAGHEVLAALFSAGGGGELSYFANAPTVLFSALFIAGYSAQRFFEDFTLKAFCIFMTGSFLAALILLPVALTAQRASLGYAGIYVLILMGVAFYKAPYRALTMALIAGVLTFPFYAVMGELVITLAQKTSLVGFNTRFEELAAVWAEISKSLPTLVFGTGWGGSFESPAVAEIRVNYTHGLLSSALLKTGLVGVILVVLYLLGLARVLWSFLFSNPVLALALAGPVLIDVFLYASFKSLDFGVVLLLITAFAFSRRGVAKTAIV